jgi:ribosomal protein S18 acetylase RimI-like enzyme
MDELRIRRARAADYDVLVETLGQRRFFDDRFSRQGAGLGVLLVAWRGGTPIGVIYLWLEAAEEPELREHLPGTPILTHLEIHPEHRRDGAGTALIEAAERRLRLLGHEQVALAVEIDNDGAARLYKRLGYEEWPHDTVACLSLTDGDGERQIEVCQIMVRRLRREPQVGGPVVEAQRPEHRPHPRQ